MRIHSFLLQAVCAAATIVSCGQKDQPSGPVIFDVGSSVNEKPFSSVDFDRLFEVVGAVPIQTSDSTLVSYVSLVGDTGNELIIESAGRLMAVRKDDGTVMAIIGRAGNGPGEFAILGDSYYDSIDDEVYVLDAARNRLLSYTADGEYTGSPFQDIPGMFRNLPDGSRFVYSMGLKPADCKYGIYSRDWKLERPCTMYADTSFSPVVFREYPVVSDDGECYFRPNRTDTLYQVTAERDIPFAVFEKGRYTVNGKPAEGDGIIDFVYRCHMLSDYIFYSFRMTSSPGTRFQVWNTKTGELVFYDYGSGDDSRGFALDVNGVGLRLWPSFVSGKDVWCVLGYAEAVRLVPELKEDDNPVLLHLRFIGK